jgi:hypothetical protein
VLGDRSPMGRRDVLRNGKLLTDKAREVVDEQGLEPRSMRPPAGGRRQRHPLPPLPDPRRVRRGGLPGCVVGDGTAGERVRTAGDTWTGLTQYLRTAFAGLATDRGTDDLMTTNLEGVPSLTAVHAHNRETIDELLRRGRTQDIIRPDLTTEDLLITWQRWAGRYPRSPRSPQTPGSARSPYSSTAFAPTRPRPHCPGRSVPIGLERLADGRRRGQWTPCGPCPPSTARAG